MDVDEYIELSFILALLVSFGIFVVFSVGLLSIGNVNGESMEPTMTEGDKFIYTDLLKPTESDIIVYKDDVLGHSESGLVVHRIKEVTDEYYITKGDGNIREDDPVSTDQYRGVVLVVFPSDSLIPDRRPIPDQSTMINTVYQPKVTYVPKSI